MERPPPSHSFPVLKNAQILQSMTKIEVPLTEAELTDPGRCKERVKEVFGALLCLCWGPDARDPAALPARVRARRASRAHPSLYDRALPEVQFFDRLSRLLRAGGCHEFGFRDLAAPQAKRFKRQLSALINFLMHREDHIGLLTQALDERQDLFLALEELAGNIETVTDQLEEAKRRDQEEKLKLQDAEAECQEMEAEIASQNKTQSALRQETESLKKNAKELEDHIANLSIALGETQAEERRLSKLVVHSPERVKADLAATSQTLEDVKRDIEEKQREKALVQKQTEHASSAEESLRRTMVRMEKMETKRQQSELAAEESDAAKKRLEDANRSLKERRHAREEQDRELEALEKQHSDTVTALTSARQTAEKELGEVLRRLSGVESERKDSIANLESCAKKVDALKSCIEHSRRQAEEDISSRIAAFHEWEEAYWAKESPLTAVLEQQE